MTFVHPIVALILGVLSLVLDRDRKAIRLEWPRLAGLLAVLAVVAVSAWSLVPEPDRMAVLGALGIGGLAVAAAAALGGAVFPAAIGVAAAASIHTFGATSQPAAQLALLAALGIGALAQGAPGTVTLAAVFVISANFLGAKNSDVPGAAWIGSEIGIAALVGAILATFLPARVSPLRPVAVALLIVLAVLAVGGKTGIDGVVVCAALGAVAGLVLHWLLDEDQIDSLRVGIAAVIGLALATIAFGLGRGAGMAVTLAGAGLVLLASGNQRALLALGPLLGLVLFRLLREAETGATRAFDIGQHYALVGLALGMVLPLLPAPKKLPSHAFWALAMALTPYVGVVLLGAKGAIGLVVGLGFSGLVQALQTPRRPESLSLASGLAAATILLLSWMRDAADMGRDDKIRLLSIAAGALALLAVAIFVLDRQTPKESRS